MSQYIQDCRQPALNSTNNVRHRLKNPSCMCICLVENNLVKTPSQPLGALTPLLAFLDPAEMPYFHRGEKQSIDFLIPS